MPNLFPLLVGRKKLLRTFLKYKKMKYYILKLRNKNLIMKTLIKILYVLKYLTFIMIRP